MFRRLSILLLMFFGAAVSAQDGVWQGYQAPPIPTTELGGVRCFLLKTGYLIEGEVKGDGLDYEIKTEYGQVRIPQANVEFLGEKREDVYRYKRERVDGTSCPQLMRFAEWCLMNGLRQEGIAEYERARHVASNPLLAETIARQIEAAGNPDAATGEWDNPFPPPSSMGRGKIDRKNTEDPDRGANGISPAVFDGFTKKVQPILVSRCASAECHGSNGESQFRISIPRQTAGSTSYRNLKSAAQWIDMEHPSESPLLSALVTSHAGVRAPFNVESKQYDAFVQWIQLAVKELPPEMNESFMARLRDQRDKTLPATGATTKTATLPPGFQNVLAAQQDIDARQNAGVPNTFFSEPGSESSQERPGTVDYKPTRLVVPNAPTDDPLDPKPFNLKHHGKVNNE